jgi:hypothetical protein
MSGHAAGLLALYRKQLTRALGLVEFPGDDQVLRHTVVMITWARNGAKGPVPPAPRPQPTYRRARMVPPEER